VSTKMNTRKIIYAWYTYSKHIIKKNR